MKERISAFFNKLKELWDNTSKKARLIFLGCVAAILIAALVLTILLNHKEYVVLYDDLATAENLQVIAVLNDASIPYQVDNGRVLVEEKDEGFARLQLAVLGFENTGFKYDLALSGGLTSTQQDKDRVALYALQDRLQATIELFPEVSKAVVTINLPQRSMFALESDKLEPSASVTLQKKTGKKLTPEQIQGIMVIVRDSVPGLTDANISIVDEAGDLKNMLESSQDYNNKKLELTDQVNRTLRDNIMAMVLPPYGEGNVEVVVMATLNTDSRVAEQNTYIPLDPENPTNNPLDYAEFDRQKTGDGFAAAGGVPGAQDNVQTPQYAEQEADAANADYYSGRDVYDYLVGSLREQIVKDGFSVEKASASIIVNASSLPDGQRDALIALASTASGIARENITVQSIQFATPTPDGTITDSSYTRVFIVAGIGLLMLCIILIIALTAISRRNKARRAAEEAEAAAAAEAEELALIDLMNQEEEYEPIALVESNEQKLKLQIKDLAESDPEIVAQLIKTWLVSGK